MSWRTRNTTSGAELRFFMSALGVVVALRCTKLLFMHADYMDQTTLLFDYWGWSWLPKLSAGGAKFVLGAGALGGVMMCVRRARVACAGSWLALVMMALFFFQDKAFFGNLNYALMCMLGVVVLARAWRAGDEDVTALEAWLPRIMLSILYVYAGVVKCHADWLSGDVITLFFQESESTAWLSHYPLLMQGLAISGAAFDLCIGPLLLHPRTRRVALVFAMGFHLTNFVTLNVGEVAFGMGVLTYAACVPAHHARMFFKPRAPSDAPDDTSPLAYQLMIALFCLFHVIFPLRAYLCDGGRESLWTHHHQDFSWWLRSSRAVGSAAFYVQIDGAPRAPVRVADYIDVEHQKGFALDASLVTQFAHHVVQDVRIEHPNAGHVAFYADIKVKLNARAPQLLMPTNVDLSTQAWRYDMTHLVYRLGDGDERVQKKEHE